MKSKLCFPSALTNTWVLEEHHGTIDDETKYYSKDSYLFETEVQNTRLDNEEILQIIKDMNAKHAVSTKL